jgi:hypothetical protein
MILQNDQSKFIYGFYMQINLDAVQLIQSKIESDKRAEDLNKLWHSNNRQEIRDKFIQKHE